MNNDAIKNYLDILYNVIKSDINDESLNVIKYILEKIPYKSVRENYYNKNINEIEFKLNTFSYIKHRFFYNELREEFIKKFEKIINEVYGEDKVFYSYIYKNKEIKKNTFDYLSGNYDNIELKKIIENLKEKENIKNEDDFFNDKFIKILNNKLEDFYDMNILGKNLEFKTISLRKTNEVNYLIIKNYLKDKSLKDEIKKEDLFNILLSIDYKVIRKLFENESLFDLNKILNSKNGEKLKTKIFTAIKFNMDNDDYYKTFVENDNSDMEKFLITKYRREKTLELMVELENPIIKSEKINIKIFENINDLTQNKFLNDFIIKNNLKIINNSVYIEREIDLNNKINKFIIDSNDGIDLDIYIKEIKNMSTNIKAEELTIFKDYLNIDNKTYDYCNLKTTKSVGKSELKKRLSLYGCILNEFGVKKYQLEELMHIAIMKRDFNLIEYIVKNIKYEINEKFKNMIDYKNNKKINRELYVTKDIIDCIENIKKYKLKSELNDNILVIKENKNKHKL